MAVYTPSLLAIDAAETRRYAGLAKARFDEAAITAACEEALLLVEPRGIWFAYDYDCARGIVLADPPFALEGSSIQSHLGGALRVVALAATVGAAVGEAVTRCFDEGRYAHAVLLDAAATAAVEQTADALEKAIRPQMAARGLTMRWRFSPGYGDWDIRAQTGLLRLTRAEEIGIGLTESFMLTPRKSVTAVIGLIRGEASREAPAGCAACPRLDCPSRKA